MFKTKMMQGKTVFGSWVTLSHPSVPEIMSLARFDFLVVDMEHSAIDLSQAQTLVQTIQGQGRRP